MFILTGVSQTHTHTHTDTVLQYGRARTNILWKLTHTANLMKKQKKVILES